MLCLPRTKVQWHKYMIIARYLMEWIWSKPSVIFMTMDWMNLSLIYKANKEIRMAVRETGAWESCLKWWYLWIIPGISPGWFNVKTAVPVSKNPENVPNSYLSFDNWKTEEYKYLGFVNRKIFNKLVSLNLRKYYFEYAVLFLNVMLRSSFLYAGESYCNLKEVEDRLKGLRKTFSGICLKHLEVAPSPS